MNVDVNIIGVLVGALAALVAGSLWYSKILFGESWMKLVGISGKEAKKGAWKAMAFAAITSLIMSFGLAYVAGLAVFFYENFDYKTAALTAGFTMWFSFQLTYILMNGAFEQRPRKLQLINAFGQLACMLAAALAIGIIGQ